jgi:major type 1 subunit fimbrin (pilin)
MFKEIIMKKNLIAAAIATVALVSGASAFAADGTVNFNGVITDNACTVDIGANNTMTVQLGTVARTALPAAGAHASPTAFQLKLAACPASVSSAVVKFDGTGYDTDTSVLKLTQEAGVATGVAIELSDASQAKLPLYTASTTYPLVAGENTLQFYARYVAMNDSVTSGPANGTSTFTVNYN